MKNNYHTIKTAIDNFTARITLHRPEKYNAMNGEMLEELYDVLQMNNSAQDVKLLVIEGEGNSFCAGADLEWMLEDTLADEKLSRFFDTLYHFSKPVIGVAHGNVFGGGIGILSLCDIVLAETNTKYCFSELKLGLAPAVILPYILNKTSVSDVMELVLTAKKFDSVKAREMGLVNRIASQQELEKELSMYVNSILNNSIPAAIEFKRLLKDVHGRPVTPEVNIKTKNSIKRLRESADARMRIEHFISRKQTIGN